MTREGKEKEGRGERRENPPLVWELRNQQKREKISLCSNFTILPFFSS